MKTESEIEKIAFLKYPRLINDPYNPTEDDNKEFRDILIEGYTLADQQTKELREEIERLKGENINLKLAIELASK